MHKNNVGIARSIIGEDVGDEPDDFGAGFREVEDFNFDAEIDTLVKRYILSRLRLPAHAENDGFKLKFNVEVEGGNIFVEGKLAVNDYHILNRIHDL